MKNRNAWTNEEIIDAVQRTVLWFQAEAPVSDRVFPREYIETTIAKLRKPPDMMFADDHAKWNIAKKKFYDSLRERLLATMSRWLDTIHGAGLSLLDPDTSVATLESDAYSAIEGAAHKAQRRVLRTSDSMLSMEGRQSKTGAVVRLGTLRSAAKHASKEQARIDAREALLNTVEDGVGNSDVGID